MAQTSLDVLVVAKRLILAGWSRAGAINAEGSPVPPRSPSAVAFSINAAVERASDYGGSAAHVGALAALQRVIGRDDIENFNLFYRTTHEMVVDAIDLAIRLKTGAYNHDHPRRTRTDRLEDVQASEARAV